MKKSWSANVGGTAHYIGFAMNDYTGRFTLTLDGTAIHKGRFSWTDQWGMFRRGPALIRFPIEGSQASLLIGSAGMTWDARFEVEPDRRADANVTVLVPSYRLPPWWAWLLAAIALIGVIVAMLLAPRRIPVAALSLAGIAGIIRFSTQWQWPLPLRVALAVGLTAAVLILSRLKAGAL